ncbi:DNA-binding FrmR family transcriptional regulator [Cryobacterium psychrotolerans]|nr:DNA-binding FrmR family transcriptional regulator [Cryobacterium psychrotolerans]
MTDIRSTEDSATAVGATATIAAEASADSHSGPHGYMSNKDAYLKRLRRIEGQARGLQGMVADDKYCIDILTQVSAMTSALQAVALGLLNDHLSHCVVEAAVKGGDEADAKVKEAFDAIARLVRS